MPAGDRWFVRTLVVLLVVWILGVGGIIAMSMRDPGDAAWITSNERVWTGTLAMRPYPMLVPDDDPEHPLLVVSMGKRGAHDRLARHDGFTVRLRGWELHRDGRRLIELAEEEDAIVDVAAGSVLPEPTAFPEPVMLEGEIVDGKCFLGAMKPGDGAGHESCAVLCLRGKLPPMLATVDAGGAPVYHLLVLDGETALSARALTHVARRVRVEGRLAWPFDGLSVLYASEDGITQLE